MIRLIKHGKTKYNKKNGKSKEVLYIALELAQAGELFDFISISGEFSEQLARYFFKQLLSSVEYCHRRMIAHRDLKLENLLLDQDFNIKLADFGFAAQLEGHNGNGLLKTKLGTYGYRAPEIILEQPYEGKPVDIFAAGVILFTMVAKLPPFGQALGRTLQTDSHQQDRNVLEAAYEGEGSGLLLGGLQRLDRRHATARARGEVHLQAHLVAPVDARASASTTRNPEGNARETQDR